MDWLLDLMGYIRNLAFKSTPIQNVDLKEVCALKTTSSFQEKGFFWSNSHSVSAIHMIPHVLLS